MFEVEAGSAHPLGTTIHRDGVNFSLFSQAATDVVLLLFDGAGAVEPMQVVRFDPYRNKTFHFWHVFLREISRVCSTRSASTVRTSPSAGHRFNANKVLIGPYARGISRRLWNRAHAVGPEDNLATSMRCAVVDVQQYNWEGDQPLRRPIHESIIYEVHTGVFNPLATSGVAHPGNIRGRRGEDSVPAGAWDHCRRAAARVRVRRFADIREPRGRSAPELLGLQHGRILQSAFGLLHRSSRPVGSPSSAAW